jgi:hypothetical protein
MSLFYCGVFLDLSKAFETVNHNILLSKPEHCGIRGTLLNWLSSYLTNRQQCVSIGLSESDKASINCGVPHTQF